MCTRLFNIRSEHFKTLKTCLLNIDLTINYVEYVKKSTEWDIFDPQCKRIEIKNPNLNSIINSCLGKKYTINPDETTIHYIKYDINGSYTLDEHHDGCKQTIIIYLDKHKSIEDEFYVDNKLIDNSNWTYNGFIMDGKLNHKGIFRGNGIRNILCIFIK